MKDKIKKRDRIIRIGDKIIKDFKIVNNRKYIKTERINKNKLNKHKRKITNDFQYYSKIEEEDKKLIAKHNGIIY